MLICLTQVVMPQPNPGECQEDTELQSVWAKLFQILAVQIKALLFLEKQEHISPGANAVRCKLAFSDTSFGVAQGFLCSFAIIVIILGWKLSNT